MFCPDCGTENSRGQKFCNRCGSNLVALERARSIISEVATGEVSNHIEPSTVLKITAAISILGLLFITLGTIFLSLIYQEHHNGPPPGLFFGLFGLIALVVIVKRLLRLIDTAPKKSAPGPLAQLLKQVPTPRTANLPLSEGSQTCYSVTEERTKQFDER